MSSRQNYDPSLCLSRIRSTLHAYRHAVAMLMHPSFKKLFAFAKLFSASLKTTSNCGRMVGQSAMLSFSLWCYPSLMERIWTVKRWWSGSPLWRQDWQDTTVGLRGGGLRWRGTQREGAQCCPPLNQGAHFSPPQHHINWGSHTFDCTCAGECCLERSSLPQTLPPPPAQLLLNQD